MNTKFRLHVQDATRTRGDNHDPDQRFQVEDYTEGRSSGSAFLLIAVATGFGQQVVNLTAGPATTTLPDGTTLPMWGYRCGTAVTGSTATCAPLTGSTSGAATGALGGIYVLNGGSGYTSAPTVTISAPTGHYRRDERHGHSDRGGERRPGGWL